MIYNKKLIVVMPAYNAAKTLQKTYDAIPKDIVDEIILVDDMSRDLTVEIANKLNIHVFRHDKNMGYGGNQKTCYKEAIKLGADIVVMLHPDYQYDPRLIRALSSLIAENIYDAVIASRILGGDSIKNGMPIYKYISNRFLTFFENFIIHKKLSEYHTGYRAFSAEMLKTLPLEKNSNDFIFDNEMLLQILFFGYRVGEVSCPTKYEADSSSINFLRSVKYGLGVMSTSLKYFLTKYKIINFDIFIK